MTRIEYTSRVLDSMRRVTAAERDAIWAELDGHIQDHMEALLDLGYDRELAEQRTMERMGDPEEVGRELDKQYPRRWLVLYRIATAAIVMLCVLCVLSGSMVFGLWKSLEARWGDHEVTSNRLIFENPMKVDIRVPVGNDVLRIYQVSTGIRDGYTVAQVAMCTYDRIPGGIVADPILHELVLTDQRGENADVPLGSSGSGSWYANYRMRYVVVEPEDTHIRLTYDYMGEYMTIKVPIPEVTL